MKHGKSTRLFCSLRSVPLSLLLLLIMSADALAATEKPLRDPTRPLAATARRTPLATASLTPSAPPALPRLQLVLTTNDRRYAVIDDQLLSEGDSLKGMRVLKIQNEAVILNTVNGPRTLPLPAATE